MELNRNQYFMIGLVLLFLGIQLYATHSVVLTPKCTKILAEKTGHPMAATIDAVDAVSGSDKTVAPSHTLVIQPWIGCSLIALGAVLALHAFAMKKPT
ncbi:MAG: hypothetical protein PVH19_14975 [Planctomycetia bacterium]|jgi:hypothetical protein